MKIWSIPVGVMLLWCAPFVGAETGKSGEEVYQAICQACHASGVGNAPVMGDPVAWSSRAEAGMEALYDHAINGLSDKGVMPPMGMCMQCSEEEVKAAVDYILEQSR